jgi:hypothetical protein
VIDVALEKQAWPFDLNAVSGQVPGDVARDIGRGQGMYDAAARAVRATPGVLRSAGRAANAALTPAGDALAKPFFSFLRGVKDKAVANPNITRGAVGLALLAPILGSTFATTRQRNEEQLMNLRQDPERDITASEKTAGSPSSFIGLPAMGGSAQSSFAGGIGSGLAQGVMSGLGGALGGGLGALRDLFLTDSKRKQLFATLLQSDVIIHDALERNPAAAEMLKEAYGTMCRFAPSLALDVNAARSFLREVVVGGSGVNYITIKNLIETEKALAQSKMAAEKVPDEVCAAIARFGFDKLAAKVYRVEEVNEKTASSIIGQKLAARVRDRRAIAAGLRDYQTVIRR